MLRRALKSGVRRRVASFLLFEGFVVFVERDRFFVAERFLMFRNAHRRRFAQRFRRRRARSVVDRLFRDRNLRTRDEGQFRVDRDFAEVDDRFHRRAVDARNDVADLQTQLRERRVRRDRLVDHRPASGLTARFRDRDRGRGAVGRRNGRNARRNGRRGGRARNGRGSNDGRRRDGVVDEAEVDVVSRAVPGVIVVARVGVGVITPAPEPALRVGAFRAFAVGGDEAGGEFRVAGRVERVKVDEVFRFEGGDFGLGRVFFEVLRLGLGGSGSESGDQASGGEGEEVLFHFRFLFIFSVENRVGGSLFSLDIRFMAKRERPRNRSTFFLFFFRDFFGRASEADFRANQR